eukprot:11980524-Ditylum_brightwellii.AAC.1
MAEASSNRLEITNLVDGMEHEGVAGNLWGTQMIVQGTNGISRESTSERVMRGQYMLSFVCLHLSALKVYPPLQDWIKTWTPPKVEFLGATRRFEGSHNICGCAYREGGIWHPILKPE